MTQTIPARPRFDESEEMRRGLREPFPPEQIGKLPRLTCKACSAKPPTCQEHKKRKCGECGNYISTAHIHLDYVGHAAVTDRLNDAAPDWTYTIDEFVDRGAVFGVYVTMTIGGISRPEYGDGDDPKEAISNAIRRAAMRFGVALDLWSREELNVPADEGHRQGGKPTAEAPETFGEGAGGAPAVGTTSSVNGPTGPLSGGTDDGPDPGVSLTPPVEGSGEVAAPGSAACLHVRGTKLDRDASRTAGHRVDVCVDCGAVVEVTRTG